MRISEVAHKQRTWVFEIASALSARDRYSLLNWIDRTPNVYYVNGMIVIYAHDFLPYFVHMREFCAPMLQLGAMGFVEYD